MLKIQAFVKVFLLVLFCNAAFAQGNNAVVDSILKHAEYYRKKNGTAKLFVHTDKTVYITNDVIWFSGYLLGVKPSELPAHQILFAALISSKSQKVAAMDKYAISAGFTHGNMAIPDTVPPGDYSFVAYTNRVIGNNPEVCFVQRLTLKTAIARSFEVELVLDTLYKDPENVRVLLNTTNKLAPLSNATVNYYLGSDPKTRIAVKTKTNVIGSCTILLPKAHITQAEHQLEVVITSGKESKTLKLDIPVKKAIPEVKFYPEGGHLVAGLLNRIGWEAKTAGGAPIKTAAVLYANNKSIDTIATDTYGMGSFYIDIVDNTNYTVKLLDYKASLTYQLPPVLSHGVALRLRDGLVTDTLRLLLANQFNAKYYLLVHNYKNVFSSSVIYGSPQGTNIKVDLTTIPRGLTTITILDSLQRPCAERLFFAHFTQSPHLSILLDKHDPGTRQNVNVKFKLTDKSGQPATGVVSVACVQDNRFSIKNDNNISNYFYLQSEIDQLPLKDNLLGNTWQDKQYLNELLLVRGWRKYTWQDMVNTTPADTADMRGGLQYSGSVIRYENPLKAPVNLVMVGDALHIVPTDKQGAFMLNNSNLITEYGKRLWLQVSGKNLKGYEVKINDPYLKLNKTFLNNLSGLNNTDAAIVINTRDEMLKGLDHVTRLREVKITHLREVIITTADALNEHQNACGDYVCRYGWLNCPIHLNDADNRAPIKGNYYMIYPSKSQVLYKGCVGLAVAEGANSLNGVFSEKEFYTADYKVIDADEPAYYSTLYWKSALNIDAKGEANITFPTSDITGKFRIVVQGLTNDDVVYSEEFFTVKGNIR